MQEKHLALKCELKNPLVLVCQKCKAKGNLNTLFQLLIDFCGASCAKKLLRKTLTHTTVHKPKRLTLAHMLRVKDRLVYWNQGRVVICASTYCCIKCAVLNIRIMVTILSKA